MATELHVVRRQGVKEKDGEQASAWLQNFMSLGVKGLRRRTESRPPHGYRTSYLPGTSPKIALFLCICFCFVLFLFDSCFVFVFANKARM